MNAANDMHFRRITDPKTSPDQTAKNIALSVNSHDSDTSNQGESQTNLNDGNEKYNSGPELILPTFYKNALTIVIAGLAVWKTILGIKYHEAFAKEDSLPLQTSATDTYQLCNVGKYNSRLRYSAELVLALTYLQASLSAAFIILSFVELCINSSKSKASNSINKKCDQQPIIATNKKMPMQMLEYCIVTFTLTAICLDVGLGWELLNFRDAQNYWFNVKIYNSFYCEKSNIFGLLVSVTILVKAAYSLSFWHNFEAWADIFKWFAAVISVVPLFTGFFLVSASLITFLFSILTVDVTDPSDCARLAAVSLDALNSHEDDYLKQHYTSCKWITHEKNFGKGFDYKTVTFDTIFHNDSMAIDLYCKYFIPNQETLDCDLQKRPIDGSSVEKMGSFTVKYSECKCIECKLYDNSMQTQSNVASFESYHVLSNMTVCYDAIYYYDESKCFSA